MSGRRRLHRGQGPIDELSLLALRCRIDRRPTVGLRWSGGDKDDGNRRGDGLRK
jgi:hypothetical protein